MQSIERPKYLVNFQANKTNNNNNNHHHLKTNNCNDNHGYLIGNGDNDFIYDAINRKQWYTWDNEKGHIISS